MFRIYFLVLSLIIAMLSGCATYSVQEVKQSPGYHKKISVNKNYQRSLLIVKNEFSAILGMDLSCMNNYDLKEGECSATAGMGTLLYITAKHIDDNVSEVEFYTAWDTNSWRKHIDVVCIQLESK
jgi:hypothetical protein